MQQPEEIAAKDLCAEACIELFFIASAMMLATH